jgi:hypothetical protein
MAATVSQQFRHPNKTLFFQREGLKPVNDVERYFAFLS